MRFLESRDASIGNPIPQLDAAVLATRYVHVGAGIVINGADGIGVLVLRIAGDKTLKCVDVIQPQGGVLSPNEDKVSGRMKRDGAQHFSFL